MFKKTRVTNNKQRQVVLRENLQKELFFIKKLGQTHEIFLYSFKANQASFLLCN